MDQIKFLKDIDVCGKNVLLRAGFDVPLKDGKIADDTRLKAGLPTIEYLIDKGALKITIATKIGRPKGRVVAELSTKPVADYLFKVVSKPAILEVTENLRFTPKEEGLDKGFAQELASSQDIFVQDAFSMLHRKETSTFLVPQLLPSVAGLLVEKELVSLNRLVGRPHKPYVVIVGGAKTETKVPLIEKVRKVADFVLIGGKTANDIIAQKKYFGIKNIILPVDFVKDEKGSAKDIGKQTVEIFIDKIQRARTIFWNGNLGKTEDKRFIDGSRKIAKALTQLKKDVFVAIGGGDTADLIDELGLEKRLEFISTGGGASLAYIAGEKLPGLEVLKMDANI